MAPYLKANLNNGLHKLLQNNLFWFNRRQNVCFGGFFIGLLTQVLALLVDKKHLSSHVKNFILRLFKKSP